MTSRSEYRLLLRQDNADRRLTPFGHTFGLIDDRRFAAFTEKYQKVDAEVERIKNTYLAPSAALDDLLESHGSTPVRDGACLADLLRRPELDYELLAPVDPSRPALSREEKRDAEIEIKYEGYIKRQLREAERFTKLENKKLPKDADYSAIRGIRAETKQKLEKFRPESIGQASRISGVSPADIQVLMIYFGIV